MRFIVTGHMEPQWNLAAEEYYLLNGEGDFFLLWRNAPSVIIGRNQNAYSEVDTAYAAQREIPVVRRLSGGGAVFHDLGNVNFSFLTDAQTGGNIDFSRFTAPIIKALSTMGVEAVLDGRNDLMVDGKKISGNAQGTLGRLDGTRRLLHHGTLLFSVDMASLSAVLKGDPDKLSSKGVDSVKSRVINIRDIPSYCGPQTVEDFMEALGLSSELVAETPTAEDEAAIEKLAREKYATWEWNFGRSGDFSARRSRRFPYGKVEVEFRTAHGRLEDVRITGDYFGFYDISVLENALLGALMTKEDILSRLTDELVEGAVHGMKKEELAALLLGLDK